jgi:DNA-binding transcriptional ArsR family regulator
MVKVNVFAALANPVRRRILELLLDEPHTVNRLVDEFKLGRPAVSEHLQVLRNARLVRAVQQGRERTYHLEPARLEELSYWLKPFARYWKQRFTELKQVMDEEP